MILGGGGGGCLADYCRDKNRLIAHDFLGLEIPACLGWVADVGKVVLDDCVLVGSAAYFVQGFQSLE